MSLKPCLSMLWGSLREKLSSWMKLLMIHGLPRPWELPWLHEMPRCRDAQQEDEQESGEDG